MTYLLLAALLAIPNAPTTPIAASTSGPTTLWGKGIRGDATLGGIVSQDAYGSATGEFVLYLTPVDDTATACIYRSFAALRFTDDTVTFDAWGDCTSVSVGGVITHWIGTNSFSFTLGTNGQLDGVDVNMSGPFGITVPGGLLDSGDFSTQ